MAARKQKNNTQNNLITTFLHVKVKWIRVLVLAVVIISILSLRFNKNSGKSHENVQKKIQEKTKNEVRKPKYWNVCTATWNPNGNLRTMNRVFQRLGYEFVNGSNGDDWDVLWSLEYPYDPRLTIFNSIYKQPLKQHQRINHFPGIGVLADKSFLTTRHHDLKYILPAFGQNNRKQFEDYAMKNPKRKFVQKFVQNRGVKVVERSEIDFSRDYKIYQAFLDNPMLIDGRGFDMGVYVLISSIHPLRIYRYNTEMLVRFCPEPYHPFNVSNTKQYVVDESHTSITNMPSFRKYSHEFGFSTKKMFEEYMKRQKHDVSKFWREIDEIITTMIGRSVHYLIRDSINLFNSTRNYFELLRFDFLMDENQNLYLMEINMSPNITPTEAKYEKNAKIREKMVYDAVNLVGVGSEFDLMSCYDQSSLEMISNLGNVAVQIDRCFDNNCDKSCLNVACTLCAACLDDDILRNLHETHREHSRRGGFKRIFPSQTHFNENFIKILSKENRILAKWLEAKCEEDSEWC